jgi:hypothetical protein
MPGYDFRNGQVPTVGFSLLYTLVIVRLDRRVLVWINVTQNPTAEWIARQLTEAFPWNEAPGYLIRDNDCVYGNVAVRRVRAMGIRDKPIAPASPWQNGFAERLIGSIRRECVDHLVVLGMAHLRRILQRCTLIITTRSGRIGSWTKMRPPCVPFSGSGPSRHTPSLAGFITKMSGFRSHGEVDSDRHTGRVRVLPPTLEATMQTVADRPEAATAIRTDLGAIFVSLELSRSTWLITSLSPGGGEKMSKHVVRGGDVAGLLERFAQLREKTRARTGKVFSFVVI